MKNRADLLPVDPSSLPWGALTAELRSGDYSLEEAKAVTRFLGILATRYSGDPVDLSVDQFLSGPHEKTEDWVDELEELLEYFGVTEKEEVLA